MFRGYHLRMPRLAWILIGALVAVGAAWFALRDRHSAPSPIVSEAATPEPSASKSLVERLDPAKAFQHRAAAVAATPEPTRAPYVVAVLPMPTGILYRSGHIRVVSTIDGMLLEFDSTARELRQLSPDAKLARRTWRIHEPEIEQSLNSSPHPVCALDLGTSRFALVFPGFSEPLRDSALILDPDGSYFLAAKPAGTGLADLRARIVLRAVQGSGSIFWFVGSRVIRTSTQLPWSSEAVVYEAKDQCRVEDVDVDDGGHLLILESRWEYEGRGQYVVVILPVSGSGSKSRELVLPSGGFDAMAALGDACVVTGGSRAVFVNLASGAVDEIREVTQPVQDLLRLNRNAVGVLTGERGAPAMQIQPSPK